MLSVRKHPRLKGYDYSQCGCYHITICVKQRRPILSRIIPAKNAAERPQVQLCKAGQVTEHYIQNIPDVYADVILEKYVIMPNHVHLLLSLGSGASVSIPTVIRSLKRMINREVGESI